MTPRELFEAIGLVDDALILEADAAPAAKAGRAVAGRRARRVLPLAACLCLVAGGVLLAARGGALRPGGGPFNGLAGGAASAANSMQAPAAAGGAAPEDALNTDQSTESAMADPEEGGAEPQAGEPGAGDRKQTADVLAGGGNEIAGNVMYWGSQLEPALQAALWGEGEPEGWQSALAALEFVDGAAPAPGPDPQMGAQTQDTGPAGLPAALPVLRDGQPLGEYALLSEADARALLLDGAFLSDEGIPRGGTALDAELDAALVYNPAGAALRLPMWAFTVPTGMAYGDVVCYVPAVDLETVQALLAEP